MRTRLVPERNPRWKQDTPRDQLVSMFMSIEGDVSNMKKGVGVVPVQLARMEDHCRQIQEILRIMEANGDRW